MNGTHFPCPICGFPDLDEPPYDSDGENPSFDICPCCGIEFGYEDCGRSHSELRVLDQAWYEVVVFTCPSRVEPAKAA